MNKLFFSIIVLLLTTTSYAQVGINTEKPTAALDINGSFLARKGILRIGKYQSSGVAGQLLQSEGPDQAPSWATVITTKRRTGYYLYKSAVSRDTDGILLTKSDNQGFNKYLEGDSQAGWTIIPNLTKTITLKAIDESNPNLTRENKVVGIFQSTIQMNNINSPDGTYIAYGIGIFVDGKLRCARVGEVTVSGRSSQSIAQVSIMGVFTDLSVGDHTIEIGVIRRNSNETLSTEADITLAIGRPAPDATNNNSFMAQSVFGVDIYLKATDSLQ